MAMLVVGDVAACVAGADVGGEMTRQLRMGQPNLCDDVFDALGNHQPRALAGRVVMLISVR